MVILSQRGLNLIPFLSSFNFIKLFDFSILCLLTYIVEIMTISIIPNKIISGNN